MSGARRDLSESAKKMSGDRRDRREESAHLDPRLVSRLHRSLMRWHAGVRRDVPWRQTTDPYRILVAEYMSQQTQLERVRAYYERFLQRFPTIEVLARASLHEVRKAWEGLGYYARARHLHEAARRIVREYGGCIPDDPAQLQTLPGCGPYTAAAVASLAFNRPVPVVDGNVRRVLCRLFALGEDPRRPALERQLRAFVARLIAVGGGARGVNQALMDLGALICRPRAPQCARCCWNFACRARQLASPTAFPRAASRTRPHYEIAVGVVWRDRAGATSRHGEGEVLIAQRREGGLLGGLWEFPGGKREPGESLRRCCAREIREEVGLRVRVGRKLMTIRHAYTHFRITMHVFECRPLDGSPRALGCQRVRWVRCRHLHRYPFPAANLRIVEALRKGELVPK
ncbi:Adenine DNA glycosylase [bacterium HR10]|nr:Adenine DNA glycosylase [bacterium HR10]